MILREHLAARTVICCKVLQPTWRIELDAIAAAPNAWVHRR
jgi:enamine deaminase RidA (YjgF/YER057c/UK114 family)